MTDVQVREANSADVDCLARMNLQLIEDERYDASFSIDALKRRMHEFMTGEFSVFLFETEDETLGYSVVDLSKRPLYLRHFFICRDHRRQGWGRASLEKLLAELNTDTLDVEVMAWNEAGREFWRSLGFVHRYEGLRWTAPSE